MVRLDRSLIGESGHVCCCFLAGKPGMAGTGGEAGQICHGESGHVCSCFLAGKPGIAGTGGEAGQISCW